MHTINVEELRNWTHTLRSLEELKSKWNVLANPLSLAYDDDDATVCLQRYSINRGVSSSIWKEFVVFPQNLAEHDQGALKIGFTSLSVFLVTVSDLPDGDIRFRREDEDIVVSSNKVINDSVGDVQMKSLPLVHFLSTSGELRPGLWGPMGLLHIHESWWQVLCPEFMKTYFSTLCDIVESDRKSKGYMPPVYPAPRDTFAWTRDLTPEQVKVVIVGERPYANVKAAGRAYSVLPPDNTSISLERIFETLDDDGRTRIGIRMHGNLADWARQGVLLLNNVLTVVTWYSHAHGLIGWQKLTDAVLDYISRHNGNVVFLLWGKKTWEKGGTIQKNNLEVETKLGERFYRYLTLYALDPIHYRICHCPKVHSIRCRGQPGCNCPKRHLEPDWERNRSGCLSMLFGKHFHETNKFLNAFGLTGIDWNSPWK